MCLVLTDNVLKLVKHVKHVKDKKKSADCLTRATAVDSFITSRGSTVR